SLGLAGVTAIDGGNRGERGELHGVISAIGGEKNRAHSIPERSACRAPRWRSGAAQQRIEFLQQSAAAEDQLPAAAAQLAPEARGADAGEQQGADLGGVAALLQVTHVALYLDALAEGGQGVLVQRAEGGDDVLVGGAEV